MTLRAALALLIAAGPASAGGPIAPRAAAAVRPPSAWLPAVSQALPAFNVPHGRALDMRLPAALVNLSRVNLDTPGGRLLARPFLEALEDSGVAGPDALARLEPEARLEVFRQAARQAADLAEARARHVLEDLRQRRVTAAQAEDMIDSLLILQGPYLNQATSAELREMHGLLKDQLARRRERRTIAKAEEEAEKLLAGRRPEDLVAAGGEEAQRHPNERRGLLRPGQGEDASIDPGLMGRAVLQRAVSRLRAASAGADFLEDALEGGVDVFLIEPSANGARLQPGQLAVYELIEDFIDLNVRALGMSGLDSERLRMTPGLADRLAAILAPTILHELKHRWTRRLIRDIPLKENEVEAMHHQALFLLEELDADPDYLKKLPSVVAESHGDLLRAWIRGPQDFVEHVANAYYRLPSVYAGEKDRLIEATQRLADWRRIRDNYDQELAELRRELKEAQDLERTMEAQELRFGGFKRSHALARRLAEFPTREAVLERIAQTEEEIAFWESEHRVETARRHYAAVWGQVQADWRAWADAHPDFDLREPLGPVTSAIRWTVRAVGRAWRSLAGPSRRRP